jgi:elongation factor Ts
MKNIKRSFIPLSLCAAMLCSASGCFKFTEKEIAAAQLAGKPAEMIEKIVMGKINKRYTEVCLMDQPWIMDDKASLAKLYKDLKVKRFARWEIGEEL